MILIQLIEMLIDIINKVNERKAIDELYNMSDRELRDIGLARCDIQYNVKRGNGR